MVGGLTRSPALAPQSVSLADGVLFNPIGPVIFWACAGTWDHCSNAERNSPTVESSPRVIVVLLLPYVTSKVNILANQNVNFLRATAQQAGVLPKNIEYGNTVTFVIMPRLTGTSSSPSTRASARMLLASKMRQQQFTQSHTEQG